LNSYKKTLDIGCDQTMWLDALEHKYIEEMSGMNFFAIINDELHTPTLTDTILDGITRKSIIDLARIKGYKVSERKLAVDEVLEAVTDGSCTEAFMCGTAAVIAPVKSFLDKGKIYELPVVADGGISMKLRKSLINIQSGIEPAPEGWLYPIQNVEL
ncbi:MAG TPA: aminotransferase class IV, partial [Bacteriovoracaceae bacterium]|nr:aminotransferase class IV [Bacteriovoracaceae bacterium]